MTDPAGPRSGDDTYDLIDDAPCQLAERRGRWLGDPLTTITLTASLINQARRMLPEQVLTALHNGATWHHTATALATDPGQAELAHSPTTPRSPTASGHTTTTQPAENRAT